MKHKNYQLTVFSNREKIVFFAKKSNLYHQLAKHSLLSSPCGGNAQCGQCKIKTELPAYEIEKSLLTNLEISEGIRLACCHEIDRDLTVVIQNPPEAIKSISNSTITIDNIDPIVHTKSISIDKKHSFTSDKAYLEHSLGAKIGNKILNYIPIAMSAKTIDAVISNNKTVISFFCKNPLLMAIDLGTTTIAGKLCDLEGNIISQANIANSQRKYGYDVISRMKYAVTGLENLRNAIINDINRLVLKLSKKLGSSDKIVYVVIAANSAMTHLAYGIPTDRLATFPYKNSINKLDTDADEIGIDSLDKGTPIHFVSLIDAYIGGDIVADLIALAGEKNFLLCDIGTNCELVLNKEGNIWATSAPSGPAFEGGNIECGMTAAIGAITKVELNEDSDLKIETIGNKPAVGIAGSGIISAISQLIKWKMINGYGKLLSPDEIDSEVSPIILKRIRKNRKGERSLFLDYQHPIYISQSDIEQFTFAKAALTSAIKVLFDCSSASWSDLTIIIAGGFGYFLSPDDLITTGIISKSAKKISVVGNAALAGAMKMLLSKNAFNQSLKFNKTIKTITLSNYKNYQNLFLTNLTH